MRVGERPGADLDEIVLLERLRDTERQLGYISQQRERATSALHRATAPILSA